MECQGDGARDSPRSHGHKLTHRRGPPSSGHISALGGWPGTGAGARGGGGVSVPGEIQKPPGHILGSRLWVALMEQGAGQGDLQRCLQPPPACVPLLEHNAVASGPGSVQGFSRAVWLVLHEHSEGADATRPKCQQGLL